MSDVATVRVAFPTMGYLVWHLSLRWQAQLSEALGPLGIKPAEYAVLAHLHRLSESDVKPNQRELADASALEPMYVSKLARSLERLRLVTRVQHPHDPRAIQLSLTRRGVSAATKGRRIASELDRQRLAAFGGPSSEQAGQLKASLQVLLREAEDTHRRAASTTTHRPPRRETPR
jgi:MarR family transcriptional regulator, organic hydroperoxide resistance regulator